MITDIGKSCPSHKILTSQIRLSTVFAKISILTVTVPSPGFTHILQVQSRQWHGIVSLSMTIYLHDLVVCADST